MLIASLTSTCNPLWSAVTLLHFGTGMTARSKSIWFVCLLLPNQLQICLKHSIVDHHQATLSNGTMDGTLLQTTWKVIRPAAHVGDKTYVWANITKTSLPPSLAIRSQNTCPTSAQTSKHHQQRSHINTWTQAIRRKHFTRPRIGTCARMSGFTGFESSCLILVPSVLQCH